MNNINKLFHEAERQYIQFLKSNDQLQNLSYFDTLSLLGNLSLHSGGLKITSELVSRSNINFSSIILEIGCGTGATTKALLSSGLDVTIVEPNYRLLLKTLKNCYDHCGNIPRYFNAYIEDCSELLNSKYDIVILECVFGFLKKKKTTLEILDSITKTEAQILLNDFYYTSIPDKITEKELGNVLGINEILTRDSYKDYFKSYKINYWKDMEPYNYEIPHEDIKKSILKNSSTEEFHFNEDEINIISNKVHAWEELFRRNRKYMNAFYSILEKKYSAVIFPNTLNSPRLSLKCVQCKYSNILHEAIRANYEYLKEWLPWPKYMLDINNCKKWCNESYDKFILNKELHMLIFERDTENFVGVVGIHNINWEESSGHLGYWCVASHAGKGLMFEAANALISHIKDYKILKKLIITTDERNIKSWRLAERLGFSLEKIMEKDQSDMSGVLRNTKSYTLNIYK